MSARRHVLIGTALLVLVGAVYFHHLRRAGFVFEDFAWFLAGPHPPPGLGARAWMHWSRYLQQRYTPSVSAFHVVNLLLHLVVSALVGWLGSRLALSAAACWFLVALFLLTPLDVEAVAYFSGRPEIFAAIGVLAACIAAAGPVTRRSSVVMLGGLGFGLLGKETAILGFALVPLTLALEPTRRRAAAVAAAVAVGAAVAGIWWYGGPRVVANYGTANGSGGEVAWWPWLLVQAAASRRLIGLTLVGGLGRQTVDFDYDVYPLAWRYLGLVVVLALPLAAWWLRRRRVIAYGLAWTFLGIMPRLLVQTPRGYFNEHQWYLPMIGLLIAGVAVWDELGSPRAC